MKPREKFIRVVAGLIVGVAIALVAVVSFVGCSSATKDIAAAAVEVGRRSDKITQHVAAAQDELATPPDEVPPTPGVIAWTGGINSHLISIDENAKGITESAAVVSEKVTQVEDKVPWWASLLGRIAIAAVVVSVIVLSWQTGLGVVVKSWLIRFGVIKPNSVLGPAKLMREAVAANPDSVEVNVAATAFRANPVNNAAFEKAKSSNGGAV